MPLCRIDCPHCGQNVEVNVTSVTRSRDCPKCGKTIILQFTTKQKRTKRTALLMPSVDAMEKIAEAPHAEHQAPRSLEGNVHARMMHDPEVQQNVRKLIWGSSILAGVIVMLSTAHYFGWWGAVESMVTRTPEVVRGPSEPHVVADTPPSPSSKPVLEPVSPAPTPPPVAVVKPAPAPAVPTPAPVIVTPTAPISDQERAIRAVGSFLNAKNVDERLQFIRDVTLMEPIVRDYYTRHPDGPIIFKKIEALPRAASSSPIATFDVQLADGRTRRATAGRSATGDYRVDWASFVIYSAMDWADFSATRPTKPVFMRVLVEPGSRYDDRFPNADWFLCIKLIDPLNPDAAPLYGYVQRRSPLGQKLGLILRTHPGEPMPMMLTLKHPTQIEGKNGDQVWVEEMIGEGWITRGT